MWRVPVARLIDVHPGADQHDLDVIRQGLMVLNTASTHPRDTLHQPTHTGLLGMMQIHRRVPSTLITDPYAAGRFSHAEEVVYQRFLLTGEIRDLCLIDRHTKVLLGINIQ